MKKTSTRLASVGGLVVLGACAIALAQHDSRYRERPSIDADNVLAKQTDPIEMDASWDRPIPGPDRPSTTAGNAVATSANRQGLVGALAVNTRSRGAEQAGSMVQRAQYTDARSSSPTGLGSGTGRSASPIVRANNDSLIGSLTDHVVMKNGAAQSGDENPLRGDRSGLTDTLPALPTSPPGSKPNTQSLSDGPALSDRPDLASLQGMQSESRTPPGAPKDALPAPGPMPSMTSLPSTQREESPRVRASVASFSDAPSGNSSGLPSLPEGPSQSLSARENSTAGSASQTPGSQVPARLVSGDTAAEPPGWLQSGRSAQSGSNPMAGRNQPTSQEQAAAAVPPALPSASGSRSMPAPPQLDGSLNGGGSLGNQNPSSGSPFAGERSNTAPARDRYSGPRSQVSDLSDTQRGVMQATDLTARESGIDTIPSLPSSRGQQAPGQQSRGIANQAPNRAAPGNSFGGRPSVEGNLKSPTQNLPSNPAGVASRGAATNTGSRAASGSQLGQDVGRMSLATLVSNRPGNRFLDGSQNPVLQIQKRAPEEIQVGKKASFIIVVRNAGNATAHGVTVMDSVPRGAKFVEAIPTARPNSEGLLNWNLGQMRPGEERSIQLQIVPEVQGEVGSVATVHFAAQASVRTVATLPKLELVVQSPPDVLIGDVQDLDVLVKNTGTGVAKDVRLEADIPNQLQHQSGDAQLEANIGDLRPNETRRIKLSLTAVAPGASKCLVRAIASDNISDSKDASVDVRAPKLVAQIQGPKLRFLERQATYRIAVKNQGTAAATNCQFQVHLPAGLKFNASDSNGHYDPAAHTVTWRLVELPAGRTAPMEVTVLPVELGPQVISFHATGDLEVEAEAKSQVVVDGLSELAFTIGQDDGTIEVGSTSTYSVQVTNVGNKSDKKVQLAVELPAGATLVAVVNAPVEYRTSGNQIIFAPIAEMRNKDQHIFRFQVRHNEPGKQIVRTKLISANWPNPVVKEEGTLVYNDQD